MYNGQIEYLSWDSNFFSKKIGRIFTDSPDNLKSCLKEAATIDYQLVYVFSNKDFFIDNNILDQFNGKLMDKKVLYEKKIEELEVHPSFVCEYDGSMLTAELELLAYEAGKYSRFKLDKNFGKNDFYRMYKIWIDNSIKHQIADNVFVVIENNIIKGLITLKKNGVVGNIGLCAVSPDIQSKGYGKALITKCENELLGVDISKLEVSTQADNTQACNFYEKCGFQIKEITNIYHFWVGYEN
jgi:dTDP-4-amino-4,6-dideoxy-D-galactose acyltransferase